MKKQKRNISSRIFQRGYNAGINGKSRDNCPHSQNLHRTQWIAGWREGREAHWDGHIGVAGLHRRIA